MVIFTLLFGLLTSQDGYFANPVMTPYGIVVTDNHGSAVYLIKDNKIKKLIDAPGCGRYYSLSSDKKLIGLKLISQDGRQTPAIYDLKSQRLARLYKPVFEAGQPSFSTNTVAFTIEKEFIVKKGSKLTKYNLGRYANLAPISPGGNYIVYNDERDQLWLLALKKNRKSCITDSKYGYFKPLWSPDGQFVAYSSLGGNIFVYDWQNKETYNIGVGRNYDWSPDSKYLIFYLTETDGHRLTGSDLYLAKYDGSEKIRLGSTPDIFEMDPKFINKKEIIFHTYDKREICIGKIINNKLKEVKTVFKAVEPLNLKYYEIKPNFGGRDSIDVPYLHQVYDTPDWHNGNWSCAPTTAMMAIAYYRKLPYWDCWCSFPYGHTSHFGNYICALYHYHEVTYDDTARDPSDSLAWGGYGYMWYDGYSPRSRMANYINYHGMNSWTDDSPTWDETIAEVNGGYPYCMCVGLTAAGHLVLAIGQVAGQHTLIFNDPYGNKNTPGYPSYDGKYARYDWPGYHYGYENLNYVYYGVGARGNWPPPSDTIVDDLQFQDGFYLHIAAPSSMRFWRDALIGFREHMWWTYTTSATEDTCYATWTPNLSQGGNYEVFAYIPGNHASSTTARYKIYYSGGSETKIVNQANYSDEWVSLGIYLFDVGSGYVQLGDATGIQGEHIGFDGMRWSYLYPGELPSKNSVIIKSNPANKYILLDINLSDRSNVDISVYDITGRSIYKEHKGILGPGPYQFQLSRIGPGIYFIRTVVGAEIITNKCVIIR